jgi:SSS family solute:Na+ symporter
MLNSASTVFTMDVYNRLLDKDASQKKLVLLGRITTLLFVAVGCIVAPMLDDEKFGGVFQYIQQFQGYIWPGVVGAFVLGFVLKRAPGSAGVASLVAGPVLYAALQFCTRQGFFAETPGVPLFQMHFLLQVLLAFLGCALLMVLITLAAPLREPRRLPLREDMDVRTEPMVVIAGALVILGVAAFYIIFW